MPLSKKIVVTIIVNECNEIAERCGGYRAALQDAVADILFYEHQHRESAINIQQRINQECDSVANLLVREGGVSATKE